MKLNILGTEYDYEVTSDREDERLCGCDGYCDAYQKRIAIEGKHNEKEPCSIKDFEALRKHTKRHEAIHAYFHESGLGDYAKNEQIVDWIACQFPKLLATFNEIEAL